MFLQMPDGTRYAALSAHRESVGELRGTLAYELHASESVHGVRRCYLGHAAEEGKRDEERLCAQHDA